MQAQPATTPNTGYSFFLYDAIAAVHRAFWHRRRRQGGFILFGGILFWLLLWYAIIAYYLLKAAVYLAVITALVLAQGLWLIVDTPFVLWQRAGYQIR